MFTAKFSAPRAVVLKQGAAAPPLRRMQMTNRPWIAERTAEINADADAISNLNIGDGVSVSAWSDIAAYTIVKKTAKTMTLRGDEATLINRDALRFHAGGFAAHCENQRDQRYSYEPDPQGEVLKISLRCWTDEDGNERRKWKKVGNATFQMGGNAYAGRRAYRDFNF
jgi:hypothetical protein